MAFLPNFFPLPTGIDLSVLFMRNHLEMTRIFYLYYKERNSDGQFALRCWVVTLWAVKDVWLQFLLLFAEVPGLFSSP
jgi:hypothetical protein